MDRRNIDLLIALALVVALGVLAAVLLRLVVPNDPVTQMRAALAALVKQMSMPPAPPVERRAPPLPPSPEEAVGKYGPRPVAPPPPGAKPPKPLTSPLGWITPDDYPAEALRNEWAGRVRIAWTVESDGHLSGCRTLASSGHVELDEATCALVMRRAVYAPARDAQGSPMAMEVGQAWSWQLPDRSSSFYGR